MPDNIRYTFNDIDDVLFFAEWVQESFEDAEEFHEYLLSRVPGLDSLTDHEGFLSVFINPSDFVEEDEEVMINDALFWDIIESEYEDGAPDVSDVSGPERMEE